MTARVLVAGVGNLFLSDDGFGVEVVRRLKERGGLPDDVELVDVGLQARDLAYQLLDGYHALVLVDATSRGGAPGTLYALEHDLDTPSDGDAVASMGGGHDIDPDVVLAQLDALAAAMGVPRPVARVLVVGCEPASFDEAMGLTPAVAAATDPAVDMVIDLTRELLEPIPEGVSR